MRADKQQHSRQAPSFQLKKAATKNFCWPSSSRPSLVTLGLTSGVHLYCLIAPNPLDDFLQLVWLLLGKNHTRETNWTKIPRHNISDILPFRYWIIYRVRTLARQTSSVLIATTTTTKNRLQIVPLQCFGKACGGSKDSLFLGMTFFICSAVRFVFSTHRKEDAKHGSDLGPVFLFRCQV